MTVTNRQRLPPPNPIQSNPQQTRPSWPQSEKTMSVLIPLPHPLHSPNYLPPPKGLPSADRSCSLQFVPLNPRPMLQGLYVQSPLPPLPHPTDTHPLGAETSSPRYSQSLRLPFLQTHTHTCKTPPPPISSPIKNTQI